MSWKTYSNNIAELDSAISDINEMQDKILDIYSSECNDCEKLLKDLSSLKEEALDLHSKLEKLYN
jgi:hypothetical protein